MAVTITLNLETVDGESALNTDKAKGKGKPIDVLSWSWGMTQSASAHVSTGAGTGSADVSDLTITKYVDKSTPTLLSNCFTGKDHKTAVLACWKVMGKAKEAIPFIKITMGGTVFISSVSTGAQGDNDRFVETVSLNFATFKVEYTPQKADQSPDATADSGDHDISKRF
jgi:type VI secretion system secreted protein Hcp